MKEKIGKIIEVIVSSVWQYVFAGLLVCAMIYICKYLEFATRGMQ